MPLEPQKQSELEYHRESFRSGDIRHEWFWDGLHHSVEDYPAIVILPDNEQRWLHHGRLHRPEELGPAWIKPQNDIEVYYRDGHIHRENGPAMISPRASKWYKYGNLHRLDGPAVIRHSVNKFEPINPSKYEWWVNGYQYSFDDLADLKIISPEEYVMLKLKYA